MEGKAGWRRGRDRESRGRGRSSEAGDDGSGEAEGKKYVGVRAGWTVNPAKLAER